MAHIFPLYEILLYAIASNVDTPSHLQSSPKQSAFTAEIPILSPVYEPGPTTTAISSISSSVSWDFASASLSVQGIIPLLYHKQKQRLSFLMYQFQAEAYLPPFSIIISLVSSSIRFIVMYIVFSGRQSEIFSDHSIATTLSSKG